MRAWRTISVGLAKVHIEVEYEDHDVDRSSFTAREEIRAVNYPALENKINQAIDEIQGEEK